MRSGPLLCSLTGVVPEINVGPYLSYLDRPGGGRPSPFLSSYSLRHLAIQLFLEAKPYPGLSGKSPISWP